MAVVWQDEAFARESVNLVPKRDLASRTTTEILLAPEPEHLERMTPALLGSGRLAATRAGEEDDEGDERRAAGH